MNTKDMELALAYWRSMAPQPKAIVYADAIEARMKGEDTSDMVVDHELANAIERGASIARSRSVNPASVTVEQKAAVKPRAKKVATAVEAKKKRG